MNGWGFVLCLVSFRSWPQIKHRVGDVRDERERERERERGENIEFQKKKKEMKNNILRKVVSQIDDAVGVYIEKLRAKIEDSVF
jgi:hypothetical protein